ncbi:MAG: hypothetical protein E6J34_15490 [Chloroflexi bacterium]|nr:MAG: hypothetical protein E6J34_15490 [Chloroflexota bacterium]
MPRFTETQIEVIRRIEQIARRYQKDVWVDDLIKDPYLEVFTPDEIEEAIYSCSEITVENDGYISTFPGI